MRRALEHGLILRAIGDTIVFSPPLVAAEDEIAEIGARYILDQPAVAGVIVGARLGIAGEVFAPGGGVEAAWISAGHLARRILEEHTP